MSDRTAKRPCRAGHLPRGILGLGRSSQGRWHRAVRLFATAGVRARRRRSSRRRQRLVASTPPAVHPAVGARSGARQYETGDEPVDLPRVPGQPQPAGTAGLCDTMRPNATMCDHAAGVAQLVERQPSKLNVVGSSPIARFDACAHIGSDAPAAPSARPSCPFSWPTGALVRKRQFIGERARPKATLRFLVGTVPFVIRRMSIARYLLTAAVGRPATYVGIQPPTRS